MPTVEVSVFEMLRTKPGDPCPGGDCDGIITEITFNWTMDFFGGDAKCSECGECWCIAEEVIGDED
jgi:hypothetical protein